MRIRDFQTKMRDVYGDVDRVRGVPATIAWIAEEVGELAQAVRKGTTAQQEHELGDVFAWLVSLANQLDIDLEEAVSRYSNGGAVALMDRETRFTGVGVGSLVRSRRRVHRKLPPDVGADVGLRLRARNDRVADSG
jgi:NTP pyrophosphatase (non-canonical NTP hydrolase)